MKLATTVLVAGVVSTALTTSAFAAALPPKEVPVSCGAMAKQGSFSLTQSPAINYRAVAPIGFGTVSGGLYFEFLRSGQVIRTAERTYSGQSPALYRFAPLPAGRYAVSIVLQTPRHSNFRTCSTVTRLMVAPRPAPSISPPLEPPLRPPHGR
ncbi:MAG TPA: hypothetical protein VN108_05825 [Marmoricola sp.]|nr:hypothetical protein [Marmoricola sp.]